MCVLLAPVNFVSNLSSPLRIASLDMLTHECARAHTPREYNITKFCTGMEGIVRRRCKTK